MESQVEPNLEELHAQFARRAFTRRRRLPCTARSSTGCCISIPPRRGWAEVGRSRPKSAEAAEVRGRAQFLEDLEAKLVAFMKP